ncbi:MAG: Do family serine endopeptidase [Thermoanaerobaculales bacterium]
MSADRQRVFSLAAVVVAAVLFGMVLSGALNFTSQVKADRPAPVSVAATGSFAAPDFATLADAVVPSVVSVFTEDVIDPSERRRQMPNDPFHFFFGPRDQREEREPQIDRSSGSGFFISATGEIITNFHVVDGADRIRVRLADDDGEYGVEVVGSDPATDIALLRITKPDREFPFLALGESSELRVGEWVMAVGNPLNMAHTVTVGVVSAKGRSLGLSRERSFENFIQTDAAINFGNSGGPLLNIRGEVIGINSAINARGQNLGFAIPVNIVRAILPQLRERGRVVRGYLGVSIENVDRDRAEAFGLDSTDGALVVQVVEGHAAEKAGVRHGDIIVMVDGRAIEDTRELIDTVSAMPPGTKVKLGLVRNGELKTISVVLEERELDTEDAVPAAGPEENGDVFEPLGVTVSELSLQIRRAYRLDDDLEGVIVTRVRPISPAADKGMIQGDVITEANGKPITDTSELGAAIEDVKAGGYLRLYVYNSRFKNYRFVILRLEE